MSQPQCIGSWAKRATATDRPAAVYFVYDIQDRLMYIGSGYDPGKRVRHHQLNMPWGRMAAAWSAEWYEDRAAAMEIEKSEICRLMPPYNIHGTSRHREVSLGFRPASRFGLAAYEGAVRAGARQGEFYGGRSFEKPEQNDTPPA